MSISITIDQKPIKFVAYRYDRPNQLLSLLRVGEKTVVTMPSGYDPDREGLPSSLTPEYEEAHDREVVTISTDSERPSTIRTVHVSRHILRWRAVLANGWTRECHVHDGPKPLNGEDLLVLAAARTADHAHSDADDDRRAKEMEPALMQEQEDAGLDREHKREFLRRMSEPVPIAPPASRPRMPNPGPRRGGFATRKIPDPVARAKVIRHYRSERRTCGGDKMLAARRTLVWMKDHKDLKKYLETGCIPRTIIRMAEGRKT